MGDNEFAEFVGIILGDGNLGIYKSKVNGKTKLQYRIKITLNSINDSLYVEYVSNLIKQIFRKSPYIWQRPDSNAVDIFIFGKSYLSFLISLGLVVSPKWNRAVIPAIFCEPPLDKFVIRGYMDTDGCICVVNNNGIRYPRIEMKISPSPMQDQLINILRNNGFKPQITRMEKGKVRVTLAGMNNLRKWVNLIGFSNSRNISVANSFLNSI